MKNKWSRTIWGALIAGVIALLLTGLYWFFQEHRSTTAAASSPTPSHQLKVQPRKVPVYAELVGMIVPTHNSLMKAEVTGRISEILVTEGDHVTAGQLLAKIDDAEYRLELDQAVQHQKSLEPLFEKTASQYQRTERLYNKEATTLVDLENAKAAYASAKANLEEAVQNSDRLTVRYNKTNIVAPYDAVIGKKLIEAGELASPGTPLFWIYEPGDFNVDVEVPERYMPFIKVHDVATVTIEKFNVSTSAIITEIVPLGLPKGHTYLVKAHLRNKGGALPNAFGRMMIPVGEREAILIPQQAIQNIGQLQMVSVLDQNKWKRHYIRTGQRTDTMVEVLSGLNGGEVIGYD